MKKNRGMRIVLTEPDEVPRAAKNNTLRVFLGISRKPIFYSVFLLGALFAAVPAQALNPSLPPGSNFDLSHWYLGLPVDDLGGTNGYSDSITATALTGGYTSEWFYTGTDGSMVFWAPVTGAKTSGTTYPRSELREQIVPGDNNTNWRSYGISILDAQCKVTQVPSTKKVIIGQIHSKTGLARPLVKIYYDNGAIKVLVKESADDVNNNDDVTYTFPSVTLNETIHYNIKMQDGFLTMTVNGTTQTRDVFALSPSWENEEHYFKAGDYCQDNVGDTNEGARIAFYSLTPYHSASITSQPASITNSAGSNVTFTVAASGNGTMSYQWFKGTNSLAGKTSATLALNSISAADAGDYTVTVLDNTSSFSAITSAVASLTVFVDHHNFANFTNPGVTNWICPTNVTAVQVECWGGGGAGGGATRLSTSGIGTGGGGAGGAYARYNSYAVTPGSTYYINVGAGGVGSTNDGSAVSGSDSWFNSINAPSSTIIAKGGAGGQSVVINDNSDRCGAGGAGSLSGSFGDVVYEGGSGATPTTTTYGGAGGGSGGTDSAGNSGIPDSGTGATAVAGGGNGGNPNATGNAGSGRTPTTPPGGGGGGARSGVTAAQFTGGTGSAGQVILIYPAYVAPSVSLTAPTNGTTFMEPASIALTASASDTDGTITTVGFYNGSTLLGSDTSPPYAYTWTNVSAGLYNLTAQATDDDGKTSTSEIVAVTVMNATYMLTVNSGIGGGLYTNGQQVAISANAPASGKVFDRWTGSTQYVNNVTYTNTVVTMPAQAIALTATYKDAADYTLTTSVGTNGTVSPASTNVLAGNSAIFVITSSNYYRIATLTTNGTSVAGVTLDNSSTATNFTWSNVQATGVLAVTFTNQVTTNAPAPVPYEWLAGYGLTNYNTAANADQDSDGLTAWQEYITGTDPTNTTSCFKAAQAARNTISWSAVSGRVYSVYWSTNLMNGFQPLETNILYPQSNYTNTTPDPRVNHYQIKVRLQ